MCLENKSSCVPTDSATGCNWMLVRLPGAGAAQVCIMSSQGGPQMLGVGIPDTPAPTGQWEGGSNSQKTLNAPRLEEHHWHHAWVCRSRTPSLHTPHLPSPGASLESTVFTGVPPSLLGLQGGEECNLGSRCRATVRGQGKRGSRQSFCPETLSQWETDACLLLEMHKCLQTSLGGSPPRRGKR